VEEEEGEACGGKKGLKRWFGVVIIRRRGE